LGARSGEQGGCSSTVICLLAKYSLTDSALSPALTFSRRHTKTHSDSNRHHSERDYHRSTTQLWNADVPASSNHTEVSFHCCHGKHAVARSLTLLVDLVCLLLILLVLLTSISSSQTWSLPSWWQNPTDMHSKWLAVKQIMFPLW
jgi:hypothetical protein